MAFRAVRRHGASGELVLKGPYTVKSGETLTQGMIVKLTSGEVEPADAGDAFAGWADDDYAAADTDCYIYDVDTVMEVVDAYARIDGAAIDVASGSQSIEATTKTNYDLVIVASSSATEKTEVVIHPKNTIYYVAS